MGHPSFETTFKTADSIVALVVVEAATFQP